MTGYKRSLGAALRILRAMLAGTDRVFTVLTLLALTAIIFVVLLQVFARYALPQSPVWTEELSRYLFIYMIVLSSGLAIARNRNVRIELFHHRLSPRWTAVYHLGCHATVGFFAMYVLPDAWQFAMIGRIQTSPALGVPMVYIFVSTVVFFALVTLYSLAGCLYAIASLINDEKAEWK